MGQAITPTGRRPDHVASTAWIRRPSPLPQHIHHIDNSFALDERVPHKLPLEVRCFCAQAVHVFFLGGEERGTPACRRARGSGGGRRIPAARHARGHRGCPLLRATASSDFSPGSTAGADATTAPATDCRDDDPARNRSFCATCRVCTRARRGPIPAAACWAARGTWLPARSPRTWAAAVHGRTSDMVWHQDPRRREVRRKERRWWLFLSTIQRASERASEWANRQTNKARTATRPDAASFQGGGDPGAACMPRLGHRECGRDWRECTCCQVKSHARERVSDRDQDRRQSQSKEQPVLAAASRRRPWRGGRERGASGAVENRIGRPGHEPGLPLPALRAREVEHDFHATARSQTLILTQCKAARSSRSAAV